MYTHLLYMYIYVYTHISMCASRCTSIHCVCTGGRASQSSQNVGSMSGQSSTIHEEHRRTIQHHATCSTAQLRPSRPDTGMMSCFLV